MSTQKFTFSQLFNRRHDCIAEFIDKCHTNQSCSYDWNRIENYLVQFADTDYKAFKKSSFEIMKNLCEEYQSIQPYEICSDIIRKRCSRIAKKSAQKRKPRSNGPPQGEIQCRVYLEKLGISFTPNFRLSCAAKRPYDLMFSYNGSNYLLEFDGQQHFEFIEWFHKTFDGFRKSQQCTIEKTQAAVDNDFKLIRICYLDQNNLEEHINKALNSPFWIYYSNEDIYGYISRNVYNILQLQIN